MNSATDFAKDLIGVDFLDSKELHIEEVPNEILAFIGQLNVPLSIYNHAESKYVYANQQFLDLTSLSKGDLPSFGQMYYGPWIEDEDYLILKDKIRARLAYVYEHYVHNEMEKLSFKINFRFKHKNHSKDLRHMLLQSNILSWDENKRPKITLDIYTDIEHRKHSSKIILTVSQFRHAWKIILEEEFLRQPKMLGKREKEIFDCMMDNNSASQIADEKKISIYTVKAHWRNILMKTGCGTREQLVHHAMEEGWL